MDEFLEAGREWLRTKYAPIALIILGIVFWSLGHAINVTRQKRLEETLAAATTSLQQAEAAVKSSQEEFAAQVWFDQSLLGGAKAKLVAAQNDLGNEADAGARYELAQAKAKNDWQKSVELAGQSRSKSLEAISLTKEVHTKIEALKAQRAQVRQNLEEANKDFKAKRASFLVVSKRLDNEGKLYLNKYMYALRSHRETGQNRLHDIDSQFAAVAIFLPPDTDQTKSGSPGLAQQELDKAKAIIVQLATETQQVTAGLDYQGEAKANGVAKVNEALKAVTDLQMHLRELELKRGYTRQLALAEAYRILTLASPELVTAKNYSNTVTSEGLPDLPAAYEAARQTLVTLSNARDAADAQVLWQDNAQILIAQYPAKLAGLDQRIKDASAAKKVLQDYHNAAAWQAVSVDIETADMKRNLAEAAVADAKSRIALSVQQFQQALTSAQNAHIELAKGAAYAQQLIDRKNELETVRASWPAQFAASQLALNTARAQITALRINGYNMSVPQQTWAMANTQLIQAGQATVQLAWEEAIAGAKNAAQTANSATAQAYAQKAAEDAAATAVAVEATRVSAAKTAQAIANENATRSAIAEATRSQEIRDASATSTARILEESHSSNGSSGSVFSNDSEPSSSGAWSSHDTGSGAWSSHDSDAGAWDEP